MTEPKLTLDSLRGKPPCKAGNIISALSDEDQAILNEALDGPEDEFPSGRIVHVFAMLGISITKDTIIKHRRGFCNCNPSRR